MDSSRRLGTRQVSLPMIFVNRKTLEPQFQAATVNSHSQLIVILIVPLSFGELDIV